MGNLALRGHRLLDGVGSVTAQVRVSGIRNIQGAAGASKMQPPPSHPALDLGPRDASYGDTSTAMQNRTEQMKHPRGHNTSQCCQLAARAHRKLAEWRATLEPLHGRALVSGGSSYDRVARMVGCWCFSVAIPERRN